VDIIAVGTTTTAETDTDLVTTITMGTDTIMDVAIEQHQVVTDITETKVSTTDTENRDVIQITDITDITIIQDIIKITTDPTIREILTTGAIPITEIRATERTIIEQITTEALIVEVQERMFLKEGDNLKYALL